ncbi:CRISPR-associated protein Csx19 [Veillonella sp. CNR 79/14]|uniref:type III-D CRISPR-associated protein Csx19 n=1 Tax=Veillonella sp. CNR 79/14 TaxID=2490954 RepID=UPI000F8C9DED|nr:CRISPR-associated protein Csx19 [Veillonella sp. CNR 79/14]
MNRNDIDMKQISPLKQLTVQQGKVIIQDIEETFSGDLTPLCKYLNGMGKIVLWMHHAVLWGHWNGTEIHWSDDTQYDGTGIVEVRIFNTKEEVYAQCVDGMLVGYHVVDTTNSENGVEIQFVDSIQPLFGEFSGSNDGFVVLADKGRKMKQVVPTDLQSKRLGLKTRNYITSSHMTGQAGYSQYRYVDIVDMTEE